MIQNYTKITVQNIEWILSVYITKVFKIYLQFKKKYILCKEIANQFSNNCLEYNF